MSRFTREAYPVVVVASVGTSTADFGIDTSGNLILNQITSAAMTGMATSTAPAYLTVKDNNGATYYLPVYTTIA
jgi:hypothetical protein